MSEVTAELEGRLAAAEPVQLARRALGDDAGAWVVGGSVRAAALDRKVDDLDLAIAGGEEAAARDLAGDRS